MDDNDMDKRNKARAKSTEDKSSMMFGRSSQGDKKVPDFRVHAQRDEERRNRKPMSNPVGGGSKKLLSAKQDSKISQHSQSAILSTGLLKDDTKFHHDSVDNERQSMVRDGGTIGDHASTSAIMHRASSTWSGGNSSDQVNVLSSSASASDFNQSGSSNKATSSSSDSGSGSGTGAAMDLVRLNKNLEGSSTSSARTSDEGNDTKEGEPRVSQTNRRSHHEWYDDSNRRRHNRRSRSSSVGVNTKGVEGRPSASSGSSSVASAPSLYSNVIDEVVSQASIKRKQKRGSVELNQTKNGDEKESGKNQLTGSKKKPKLESDARPHDAIKKADKPERKMPQLDRKQPANNETNHPLDDMRLTEDSQRPHVAIAGEDVQIPSTRTQEKRHHAQGTSISRKRSQHKKPNVSGAIQFAPGNNKFCGSVSTMSSSQFHGSAQHVEFQKGGNTGADGANQQKEGPGAKGCESKSLSDLSWSGLSSSKGNSSAGGSDNSDENRRRDTGSPASSSEDDKHLESHANTNQGTGVKSQGVRNEDISSSADDEAPDSSSGQDNQAHGSSLDDDSGDTPRFRGSLTTQNVQKNNDEQQQKMDGHNFAFKDKMISYSQHKSSSEELPTSSCSDDVDSNSVKSSGDEDKDNKGMAQGNQEQGSEQSWQDDPMSSGESSGNLLYAKSGAASPSSSEYAVCPCLCAVGSRKQREAKAQWMELLKKRPTYQDESAVKDWLLEVMQAAQNPNL